MSARPGVAQASHKSRPTLPDSWMKKALCRDLSIDFHSDDRAEIEQAKSTCANCPVAQHCLAYALAGRETTGVWGGMSADERSGAFRKWKSCEPVTLDSNGHRVCRHCQAAFVPPHHRSHYCTPECRDRGRSANSRMYEARHRQKRRQEQAGAS